MATKPAEPVFSDFEKQAMRERAKELRAEAKMNKNRAEGEKAIDAVIALMKEPDKSMAKRIHKLVTETAPQLFPKTWYSMPAYANADGKVVCFFQAGSKFEARYSTLGFNDSANLDDGNMWPTSFVLLKLTPVEEKRIIELVKKAVS